jgi:AmmeMemoRadiSam system protein A
MSGVSMLDDAVPRDGGSLAAHADELIALAEAAIDHGLVHGRPPAVDEAGYDTALLAHRAAFVTLFDRAGELRGCMGSIEAYRPLVAEVSGNAFAAAFRDPRFLPLMAHERDGLACKLSVLSPPEPVAFSDEAELVAGLRPGVDGVILESGDCRGTFLPAVWEHIPDPVAFWRELKRKAGLPGNGLPEDLVVWRYEAESLG